MGGRPAAAPRCAALVGTYLSGKTTLLESLLFATGAITPQGHGQGGQHASATAPPRRAARKMTVEINAASAEFLDETLDLSRLPRLGRADPGGAERAAGRRCRGRRLRARGGQGADAGAAVQVPRRPPDPAPAVHQQDGHRRAIACARCWRRCRPSQPARWCCARCRSGDKRATSVTGYVDLVSERAYNYKPGQASDLIKMPEEIAPREQEARTRAARIARRFRRRAAGAAARGCGAARRTRSISS